MREEALVEMAAAMEGPGRVSAQEADVSFLEVEHNVAKAGGLAGR